MSNQDKTKRKRSAFERKMDKRVEKRMQELYKNKEFRIQLEEEMEKIKTLDDLNNYQQNAAKNSRNEVEEKKKDES